VPLDIDRGRALLDKACRDDQPQACLVYAIVCSGGSLGPESAARAPALLRRACDHGSADACALLAKVLEHPGREAK
jgi:TPR repeat protein